MTGGEYGNKIKSVEEEWKKFSDAVLKCATEVCGCGRVGQGIRKRRNRWNDKVRIAVLPKRKVFELWLQQGSEKVFDEYREERRRVKAVVEEAKREAEERFGMKLSQNFEGNRKMFWKEVKKVRKGVQGDEMRVKDRD